MPRSPLAHFQDPFPLVTELWVGSSRKSLSGNGSALLREIARLRCEDHVRAKNGVWVMRPGHSHARETRAKISAAQNSPDARAKRRAYWTPERRREARELTKQRMKDPVVRARIAERTKAAMADPAIKLRQRVAHAQAMARPDVRAKISAATRKAMANPEVRKRISERMKERQAAVVDEIWRVFVVNHERKNLRFAWTAARQEVRQAFLCDLGVAERDAWTLAQRLLGRCLRSSFVLAIGLPGTSKSRSARFPTLLCVLPSLSAVISTIEQDAHSLA